MDRPLDAVLKAAADGQPSAWRQLTQAYTGRVWALIYRQCKNAELAEEITQDTFVRIVEKLPDYAERGHFESWLFRIALNRLRDEMRRRKRQAVPIDWHETPPETLGYNPDQPGPQIGLEKAERNEQLRHAFDRLPEADRVVLGLRFNGDLSFQQIADTLEQPLGTVLARNHRALKKLKAMLEENDND